MKAIKIICKNNTEFIYNDESEVKRDFLFDLCDIAVFGIDDIYEGSKNLRMEKIIETDGECDKEVEEIFRETLGYLRLIAETKEICDEDTIIVNWF